MQNVDVLYLSKDNRSTNIVCIDGKKTNIDKLLNNVLDELCYQSLSTFNGMVEAINHIYDIHNYVPLYLNEDLILQPIYPKKYWTQIYINITMIKDIIPNNDNIYTFKKKSIDKACKDKDCKYYKNEFKIEVHFADV